MIDNCPRCNGRCTAITRQGDSVRVEFWACRHDMRVIASGSDQEVAERVNAVIAARR